MDLALYDIADADIVGVAIVMLFAASLGLNIARSLLSVRSIMSPPDGVMYESVKIIDVAEPGAAPSLACIVYCSVVYPDGT